MTTSLHYNGKAFLYAATTELPRTGNLSASPHTGRTSSRRSVADASQGFLEQADRLIG